jgi:LmbE family N-acetylglucosaminyl deacetylase
MNRNLFLIGKRICFIGAHPDDIELGCGALIANIAGRAELLCLTLSDNKKNPELQNLVNEHRVSMAILGIKPELDIVKDFETRRFPHSRQEILETMLDVRREFKPDLVFVHTKNDIHQDHITTTEEALRAFRGTTVLGFDVLRSSYGFFPHFLFEVNEADVEKKIEALSAYTTYKERYYFDKEITRSTLIRYGALAERAYAEGFDIIRVVAQFGLD